MKREKVRLEELRSMAYEEYLRTPEWQDTRKAALKRAGNRCQVCRQGDVALNVYHTTYETLGCEQESDVIALCEACYDLLSQQQKLTANDSTAETTGEEPAYPHFSFSQRALVFTPSALVGVGLPAFLHAPLPAELFGLGAAIALAINSPKLYAEMRDSLPAPLVEFLDGRAARKRERAKAGEWNNWDRLLGRHLHDGDPDQADDTLVVAEEDIESDGQQDYLNLGPTLKTHADSMLSKRKVILGVSGSGKTNNMIVYCEELGKLEPAPAIILFDTDDENRGLCNRKYLPNPAWLDKSKGLSVKNAFETAQTILEKRYQCVINLQSYEEEEAAWIMINMVRGVRAWQEARKVRVPCEIVLDEASVWLPQNPRESLLSGIMIDDASAFLDEDEDEEEETLVAGRERASKKISLLALLQRVCFPIVRRGRRRGIGVTLAAQRIAEIDKRALQGSWMFLMRQTQPADWREYRKYGISPQEAMDLLDGEAFVIAPEKPMEKHRLRESHSPHGGITPGMKALRGSTKEKQVERGAAALAPEPRGLPASAHTSYSQPARQDQPPASPQARPVLQEQIAFRYQEPDAPPYQPGAAPEPYTRQAQPSTTAQAPGSWQGAERTQHFAKGVGPELQAAYEAYRPGMNHHILARHLGTTPSVAGQLLKQLQQRGLIDADGNKKREKVVPIVRKPGLRAADIDLEEAIQAWNAGHNSEDKLMRRFPGLNKYQAGLLRDRMFPPAVAK
jgi:hypothetical protein